MGDAGFEILKTEDDVVIEKVNQAFIVTSIYRLDQTGTSNLEPFTDGGKYLTTSKTYGLLSASFRQEGVLVAAKHEGNEDAFLFIPHLASHIPLRAFGLHKYLLFLYSPISMPDSFYDYFKSIKGGVNSSEQLNPNDNKLPDFDTVIERYGIILAQPPQIKTEVGHEVFQNDKLRDLIESKHCLLRGEARPTLGKESVKLLVYDVLVDVISLA